MNRGPARVRDERVTACIDVHSHFFPLEVLDALRKEGARYRTQVRAAADGRASW